MSDYMPLLFQETIQHTPSATKSPRKSRISSKFKNIHAQRNPELRPSENVQAQSAFLPEELLPSILLAVQSDASSEYNLNSRRGRLFADNPAQGFALEFSSDGIHFTVHSDDTFWNMRLIGYGNSNALEEIPRTQPYALRNRVEYDYDKLTEWYLNGPLGLEQCFTLYEPPQLSESGKLMLELEFTGDLQFGQTQDGNVLLTDTRGNNVLHYNQLHVVDALDHILPARFDVFPVDNRVSVLITVDAANAAYPILVDPLVSLRSDFAASDAASNDNLGFSVAVSGDFAVVGAYQADTTGGANAGAAYVFARTYTETGISWTEYKLTASDGAANDHFGYAVAVDGDTVVVGAPDADVSGDTDAGAVYVYFWDGSSWNEQQKLTASNRATADKFGYAVALDGDTVVIGAPLVAAVDIDQGAVYIFTRSSSTWTQRTEFTAGFAGDNSFASSVAIRGTTLVVGANGFDEPTVTQGAVFIYTGSGASWSLQQELLLASPATGDLFGFSVALSPNGLYLIAGATGRDTVHGTNAGAAFIYHYNGSAWSLEYTAIPSVGSANDNFGQYVAISDNAALVSAPLYNSGHGIVFYYELTSKGWIEADHLSPGAAGDNYGISLGMTNDRKIIGASGLQGGKGGAYVFASGPDEPFNPHQCSPLGTCDCCDWSFLHPIGARHGEKRETFTDLTLNSPAGALTLTRTYLQNEHSFYQFMGLGWTHNHAMSLELISGSPNIIVVRWENGGLAQYTETSTDHYDGVAGMTSVVDWDGGSSQYTVTLANKSTAVFDSDGKVLSRSWPSGEVWTYTYSSGILTEVSDDYSRQLVFRYYSGGDFDGQLYRVGDQSFDDSNPSSPTGRYIEYGYTLNRIVDTDGAIVDGTDALLTSVRDVNGNTWTYVYYGAGTDETDVRQLNYLIEIDSPAVDATGSGTPDSSIAVKQLTYTMNGTELAVNGSMELNSSWTNISGAAPTTNAQSSTEADSGTYSRHVVASSANQGIEGAAWNLTSGLTYIITARVYPVSGAVKMQVTSQSDFDRTSTSTGAWETLRAVYTATSSVTGRKLQFIASGAAAEFYVDSVSIIETDFTVSMIEQSLGDAALTTTYEFQPDGQNLTTETTAGKMTTHYFDNGVYLGPKNPAGNSTAQYLSPVYRPEVIRDANQNQTSLVWSSDGKLLSDVTDAAGNHTSFSYNDSGDSVDTLDQSTDAQGQTTQYLYEDSGNPRLPTTVKVYDLDGTTVLRWQEFTYDAKGRTTEEDVIDPTDGTTALQTTTRTYYPASSGDPGYDANGAGLLQSVTQHDLLDSGNNASTTYTYDSVGRVVKTQQSSLFGSCHVSYTVYDASGNVLASICNYSNSEDAPTTVSEAAALYDSDHPEKNHVTTYAYDTLNRRVGTTINAGSDFALTTLTFYDGFNRVVRTISNYVNQNGGDPETPALWIWSSTNIRWEVGVSDDTPIDHGTDQTQNILSDTAYNERGLVRLQRGTLGNVTLLGYDDADRVVKTVQNASQPDYNNFYTGVSPDPSLHLYSPNNAADQDIVTTNLYDPVGNLVKTVDSAGQTTLIGHDALNRSIKTIRNAYSLYNVLADPTLADYFISSDVGRDIFETTEYDAMGRVKRTQDTLSNWTLYGYDPLGRQVRVIRNASNPTYNSSSDPDLSAYTSGSANDQDLITDTVYDVQGRVLYTVDLNSNNTWFAYDGLGRQIKTIVNAVGTATDDGSSDPRSDSYSASVDPDKDLISITTYNSDGQVQWTQDAFGRKTWYVYDSISRQIKVIQNCTYTSGSPAPEDDTYIGEHDSDPAKDVISQTIYDAQGRIAVTIDSRSNETHFAYDVLGRRTQVVTNYVDGDFDPDFPDEDLIQTTTYDLAGRVVITVDNAGNETRYEYDALGRRTRTTVNYDDGIYDSTHPDQDLISSTVYNKSGQVMSMTDARGTQTSFTYDGASRRITVTQAEGTPLATTSYANYDKAGRTLRTIQNWVSNGIPPDLRDLGGNFSFVPTTHGLNEDQNLITTYTFDKLGRQVVIMDVLGNETTNVYRRDGQIVSTTDPLGVVTVYRYDAIGRRTLVVQSYQSNGEDPALWVWDDGTDQRWETSGGTAIAHGTNNDQNVLVQTSYDKGGRMISLRDPRGSLAEYGYDLLGRRTSLTNPLSQEWVTTYADVSGGTSRVTLTDPLTFQTQRDFDKLGRTASIQYLDESPKLTPDVTFGYDAAGNRITMSESVGVTPLRVTNYGYDAVRRPVSIGFDDDGDGIVDETVAYEYDAGGLRTKLTLPIDLDIAYTYDVKGRLVGLSDWDEQMTRFAYDSVGRPLSVQRPNWLQSRYHFDAGGRLRRLHHYSLGTTFADFQYTVDARGNRTQATEFLPSLSTGSTTFDKDNGAVQYLLGTWTDDGDFKVSSNISASLSVIFGGDEVTLTMGVGPDHSLYDLYIDNSYWDSIDGYAASVDEQDIDIQLLDDGLHTLEVRNRREKNGQSSGFTVRFKQLVSNHEYDLHNWDYSYDALARLLSADLHPTFDLDAPSPRVYAYGYDLAGNRLSESLALDGDTPTVTSHSYNAANQISDFTYDDNGNLNDDGTNSYTWDRANRMLSMGSANYDYDGAGNRISQTVSSVVTNYLLDLQPGLANVLLATQGANTTSYVHAPRGIHAQKDASGNWEWMLQDGLGSVRSVVDSSLNPLESRLYDPYGVPFGTSGTSQTTYGFTGEQTDANNLLYLRARYYAPSLGVFTGLDPLAGTIRRPMSLNRYMWVEGNVINGFDPSGFGGCFDNALELGIAGGFGCNGGGGFDGGSGFDGTVSGVVEAPAPDYIPNVGEGTYEDGTGDDGTEDDGNPNPLPPQLPQSPVQPQGPNWLGRSIAALIGAVVGYELWRLIQTLPCSQPQPTQTPTAQPTPTATPKPSCDPNSFEKWWDTLPLAGGIYNLDWYRYEQQVARDAPDTLGGNRPRTVPAGSKEVNADGAIKNNCRLVDAKYNFGTKPPPWAPDLEDEFSRYRLAVTVPNNVAGAQPSGLEVRISNNKSEAYFLDLLQRHGFTINVDGFVNIVAFRR